MDLCRAYEHSTALSMAGLLRHTSILCKVQGTDGRFNVQRPPALPDTWQQASSPKVV